MIETMESLEHRILSFVVISPSSFLSLLAELKVIYGDLLEFPLNEIESEVFRVSKFLFDKQYIIAEHTDDFENPSGIFYTFL